MSRAPARNGAAPRRPGEEDGELHTQLLTLRLQQTFANSTSPPDSDICPVCKSSRYLNPNMRFLVNPECYHKMCESCVDRIFSQGPAPCPVAGCARTLRKQRFRKQTFGDITVEREVDIRRRVAQTFNRRQEEFTSLLAYNNYLEEVETLTFNLLNNIDVPQTEAKLSSYAAQNASSIARNTNLSSQESASTEAFFAAQKELARSRREAARREEGEERREREEGRREITERIARGDGDAEQIAREGQRVVLKKSTARRTAAEKARQQQQQHQQLSSTPNNPFGGPLGNGAADTSFTIQGLRPIVEAEPEKPYDPFGGLSSQRSYYALQDSYDNPWLDKARTDVHIIAGGYDVREYCARTMLEAFAGFGCFIEEEVSARDMPSDAGVATAAAAAAAGGEGDGDTSMAEVP